MDKKINKIKQLNRMIAKYDVCMIALRFLKKEIQSERYKEKEIGYDIKKSIIAVRVILPNRTSKRRTSWSLFAISVFLKKLNDWNTDSERFFSPRVVFEKENDVSILGVAEASIMSLRRIKSSKSWRQDAQYFTEMASDRAYILISSSSKEY